MFAVQGLGHAEWENGLATFEATEAANVKATSSDGRRGRAWRRWRHAVRHAKVHRHRAFVDRSQTYHRSYLRGRCICYKRRLSITETEYLTIKSVGAFECYQRLETRKRRDNAKNCACQSCRNPRHSGYSRPFYKLTMQERIAVEIGFEVSE
jgi:hypothetical protein